MWWNAAFATAPDRRAARGSAPGRGRASSGNAGGECGEAQGAAHRRLPGVPGQQLVAPGHLADAGARAQQPVALAHVDVTEAASRLRPVVRRWPELRHPDHGREGRSPEGAGALRLCGESDRVGTRSVPTPGSRAAATPVATCTRSSWKETCRLYETWNTRIAERQVGSRLRSDVVAEVQRAAAQRLDLRRCCRPADPAGPAALERGEGRSRQPRHPVHHRRHEQPPPVAGQARCRVAEQPGLSADGGPVPAEGVVPAEGIRQATPAAWSWR